MADTAGMVLPHEILWLGENFWAFSIGTACPKTRLGLLQLLKGGGGGEREKVRVFALNAKFMGSVSD